MPPVSGSSSPSTASAVSRDAGREERVLAAVAGDAELGQAEDADALAGAPRRSPREMFAWLPSQSSGVWLRAAAATLTSLMAYGLSLGGILVLRMARISRTALSGCTHSPGASLCAERFTRRVHRHAPGLIALFALLGWGCGGDDGAASPGGGGMQIGGGGFSVAFDKARSTIEVRRGKEALLTLPADSFVVGRVDDVNDTTNYDPWPVVAKTAGYMPPAGLAFRSAVAATARRTDARTLNVDLEFEGGTLAALEITESGPGNFKAKLLPQSGGEPLAYYRLRPPVSSSEGFYGLGEYFDSVKHRGKLRAMQLELDTDDRELVQRGPRPDTLRDRNARLGTVRRIALPRRVRRRRAVEPIRSRSTFGTGTASAATGSPFTSSPPTHPLDVTKHYYDVTGYPVLPARWALGPLDLARRERRPGPGRDRPRDDPRPRSRDDRHLDRSTLRDAA